MADEHIAIGAYPAEMTGVQVGEEDYRQRAMAECVRFAAAIRDKLGSEPPGARLRVKAQPHELGEYLEVVCYFEEGNDEALAYAFACEAHSPTTWNDIAPYDWRNPPSVLAKYVTDQAD